MTTFYFPMTTEGKGVGLMSCVNQSFIVISVEVFRRIECSVRSAEVGSFLKIA